MSQEKKTRHVPRLLAVVPLLVLLANLWEHLSLENRQLSKVNGSFAFVLVVLIVVYVALNILGIFKPGIGKKINHYAPLFILISGFLLVWDYTTLKTNLLHLPYFPGPDKVLGVYVSDWDRLGLSVLYSLRLLFTGYGIGASVGFITGIAIGWNKDFHYWINPFLKVIGPIPATAWIPLSMVILPSSFWAGVFLIALSVWFPMTVMTSSGIAGVKNSWFEVARTLGAKQGFLIFKVAIPAAYPLIFIGLFMGMGMSFATLIVAEMLGVKAGLGFFITWSQGWGEYYKVYAVLILIALLFSLLLTFLFRIKDRILIWQKGLIKW